MSSLAVRLAVGLSAFGLVALLLTARVLEPELGGLGTHQQLGLPPCSMRVLFGLRCPACGMTTSWSWLTRGNLIASAEASLSGMFLGLFALVVIVVGFRWAASGRSPRSAVNWWLGFGVVSIGIVCVTEWLVRLRLG